MAQPNPFAHTKKTMVCPDGSTHAYFSLPELKDPRIDTLPYSIKVLLESAVRNCDEFQVEKKDVENIIDWQKKCPSGDVEISFKPARVILQDFTGVPCVVDLAAMRDAMSALGGSPELINPQVPVDLVIDHSVQVDVARVEGASVKNAEIEFQRNNERFSFLKWGSKAFQNFSVVPPGSGIVHQVNLEYLARVVFTDSEVLYPDSVVGTDSHTTMINGLGVTGWGVGGIEAESVMLGQPMSMVLPRVVGFHLSGTLTTGVTATDLVLTCVKMLRAHGVVGKFVEFYGPGCQALSLADRATIANMAPEYGATMGFFPVDEKTIEYLTLTGRTPEKVKLIEAYMREVGMFVDYTKPLPKITYSEDISLDLGTVTPCISGPKRPHDHVPIAQMKADWQSCLDSPVGFKGFAIPKEKQSATAEFSFEGQKYTITHGSVVIAAITSCTNTSNPSVMLGAGIVAQRALAKGLKIKPYIKSSLAPGSGVVTLYLKESGLEDALAQLGFSTVGYGCTTCIGNSGNLMSEEIDNAITAGDLVASAVLSGNRNFEGRVHPLTRANYLASPPLVVAYAIAGTMNIDFETEPLGVGADGAPVFLRDIWPSTAEVEAVVASSVKPEMFRNTYSTISTSNPMWNALPVMEGSTYQWDPTSTYVHDPPFFKGMAPTAPGGKSVVGARCLLNFGDSITTDHISPAGNIAKDSPAAKFLGERGIERKDFNSYGARRGNDEIMARGTFANVRIVNKFMEGKVGPHTVHVPSKQAGYIYDVAKQYMDAGVPTIILAGREYGSGSSRDWAAKGPYLQGVKAVIAKSFERIHRSNLVGMGLIPLCFKDGEDADSLGLTGYEEYTIDLPTELVPGMDITVKADAKSFKCTLRFDTKVELAYFANGGILHYVLRNLKERASA